jgi:hypothetical protein
VLPIYRPSPEVGARFAVQTTSHSRARRRRRSSPDTSLFPTFPAPLTPPPKNPAAQEAADPALYASNVRRLMAQRLGVSLATEDRSIAQALEAAGVKPSLDGRSVVAPPGVIDGRGYVDLGPYLAEVAARAGKRAKKAE